jgi:hypothetical protein
MRLTGTVLYRNKQDSSPPASCHKSDPAIEYDRHGSTPPHAGRSCILSTYLVPGMRRNVAFSGGGMCSHESAGMEHRALPTRR